VTRPLRRCAADDGCALAYRIDGPAGAPPLVLAHALGTDHTLFDGVVPRLARAWRVVRYDARGHGASEAPALAPDLARLGRDVLALLDHLAIARAHVGGVSIGGLTALWLGVHAAARVDRLVLANTAARIGSATAWTERQQLVERGGLAAVADATLARWCTARFRERDPSATARLRATLLATSLPGYLGACAALRDADLRGEVSQVRAPTLVVTGAHDVATPPADGAWLAAAIPGATLVELDAAHLAPIEAASSFEAAVERFLTR
jgi:3-oxoadipate enol-lactonase